MKLPRRTIVAALVVFAAFVVFDLCGRVPASPMPAADRIAEVAAGVPVVDFDRLAEGDRAWPDGGAVAAAVPVAEEIRALGGSRVAVAGYMLPTEVEQGRARRFLLCRYPGGCCFGGTIEADDLIECDVAASGGAEVVTHVPVVVVGTFRVREPPEDTTNGIYALEGCEVRAVAAPDAE